MLCNSEHTKSKEITNNKKDTVQPSFTPLHVKTTIMQTAQERTSSTTNYMTHGQRSHNRKRTEKKEKRANYTKLVF